MSVIHEEQTTTVDLKTGEVLEESVQRIIHSDEPDWVKLYVKAWCDFKNVKGINSQFLYNLLPYMSYADEGQYIFITPFLKRQIAKKLKWKSHSALQVFNNNLRKLVQQNVLKHLDTNTYQVNPELIGKGEWKDIRRLRATFNLETGEITHQYAQEDDNRESE